MNTAGACRRHRARADGLLSERRLAILRGACFDRPIVRSPYDGGGSELNGVSMHADRMWNSLPGLGVLIHGVVEWSSGHALPCKAALYSIDETGVHLIWRIDAASLRVLPDPSGDAFALMYHDEERHQSTGKFALTSVVEVYEVLPGGLKQVLRQRY